MATISTRKGMTLFEVIGSFVLLTAFITLMISILSFTGKAEDVQDTISDYGLKSSIFHRILSAPCTNNNYEYRSEIRKYIADKMQLDHEAENIGFSCIDLGNTKYRVDIKDLETGQRWTFANFQPTEKKPMNPDFDIIMQVNSNSETVEEEEYQAQDEYHVAILAAQIIPNAYTDMLQDEMYCEKGSDDFEYIYDSGSKISDIFKYDDNNCLNENCIKGAGQLNATCQPEYCTYSGTSGTSCSYGCECKSSTCESGKCTSGAPDKLSLGQPCIGSFTDSCASGICAINLRCSESFDALNRLLTGTVRDKATGEPIAGAVVSVKNTDVEAISDESGDFIMPDVDMSFFIGEQTTVLANVLAEKTGYLPYESEKMALTKGVSSHIEILMEVG